MTLPPSLTPRSKWGLSILGVNLIILLIYYALILVLLSANQDYRALQGLFLYMGHAFILFCLALFHMLRRQHQRGAEYLFASFVLAIIGFGLCMFTSTQLSLYY